jgi:hypothetical protein
MQRAVKMFGVGFLFAGLALAPLRAMGQEPPDQGQILWQSCEPGETIGLDTLAVWGVDPKDVTGIGLENEAGEFVCPPSGRFPIPPGPSGNLSDWDRIRRAIGAWAGVIVAPLFPDPPPPASEEGGEEPDQPPPAPPPAPPPGGYAVPRGVR